MLSQGRFDLTFRNIFYWLLIVTLLELTLAGSGRLFQFGPLTVRMYLFFFCLGLSVVYYILRQSIAPVFFYLTGIYTLILGFAGFQGVLNGGEAGLIFEDIKPLSFFYSILFFSIAIRTIDDIRLVSKILKLSSMILSVGYLMFLTLGVLGVINIMDFYVLLNDTGEFMFRGTFGLFYKGFLFICIGLLFFLVSEKKKERLLAIIPFVALVLTFTRGFLIAVVLVYFLFLAFYARNKMKSYLVILCFAILAIIAIPFYLESIGDKSDSDVVRVKQLSQVEERITPFSTVIGNGLGIGVPVRPSHMEISFLEIFHKQGLVGLAFWFGVMALQAFYFRKAKARGFLSEGLPYLLSTIFVYMQSFTNPFINNPIGMSVVIVSLVIQRKLATAPLAINSSNG